MQADGELERLVGFGGQDFDAAVQQAVHRVQNAHAHLPERFKPQRRIDPAQLPDAAAKVEMLARSLAALSEAGYDYVGMDHFALPGDALAVARRQARLPVARGLALSRDDLVRRAVIMALMCQGEALFESIDFVRAVAMVFDRHLQADRDRARFSRIL